MGGLRRFVVLHDPDGRFRLAAQTRADEIRRAMGELGRHEGQDFSVELHPVSRAGQVTNALLYGHTARGARVRQPAATSVDFFHHATPDAIVLDSAPGAATNLAVGTSFPGSMGRVELQATPFVRALKNLEPWGEVSVHGCQFGRAEAGYPAGARQLANALNVVVHAYSNPGGTIFTQDPALATGRRRATAADCNAGQNEWFHDRNKPVWMVPCRGDVAAHRRTFVPKSMEDAARARANLLARESSSPSRLGGLLGSRETLHRYDARLTAPGGICGANRTFLTLGLDPGLGARIGAAGVYQGPGGYSEPPSYSATLEAARRNVSRLDARLTPTPPFVIPH